MSDTLRDIPREITEVLNENWVPSRVVYGTDEPDGFSSVRGWAAHVAEAILAIPGIAVVQLPGQMVDREEVPKAIRHQSMWEREYAWATIQDDGLIYFENGSGGSGYGTVNAAEARDLAAALLAAADYAERDQ